MPLPESNTNNLISLSEVLTQNQDSEVIKTDSPIPLPDTQKQPTGGLNDQPPQDNTPGSIIDAYITEKPATISEQGISTNLIIDPSNPNSIATETTIIDSTKDPLTGESLISQTSTPSNLSGITEATGDVVIGELVDTANTKPDSTTPSTTLLTDNLSINSVDNNFDNITTNNNTSLLDTTKTDTTQITSNINEISNTDKPPVTDAIASNNNNSTTSSQSLTNAIASNNNNSTTSSQSLTDAIKPLKTDQSTQNFDNSIITTDKPKLDNQLSISTIPDNPIYKSGYFTVGNNGIVGFDYLNDGGGYQGEIGIFSLLGMEKYTPGSPEFIAEAARRVTSNSTEGYVVISDIAEGARFSSSENYGEYLGVKNFTMRPGDTFAIMLIPNGTAAEVKANAKIQGNKRPLFSLVSANPEAGMHLGQIADITGNGSTFSMEDLRVDGYTDRDYNDMIFQVRGAIGKAVLLDDVIDKNNDWRETEAGQALIDYIKPYENQILSEKDTPKPKPNFSHENQPITAIISTGFQNNEIENQIILGSDLINNDDNPITDNAKEPGTKVLDIISNANNNTDIFLSRSVGSGHWYDSVQEFLDNLKTSPQPNAVINIHAELTQVNDNGIETTRYQFTTEERQILESARQQGVLIVVPAGDNGGVMSILGQASQEFDNIITVGAAININPSLPLMQGVDRAPNSNYGYGLDILAFGNQNGENIISETSAAAAQVTGAISQIWAANPDLNYRQVIEIIKSTATDLSAPGWDLKTGAGLLNQEAAIAQAKITEPVDYDTAPITKLEGNFNGDLPKENTPTKTNIIINNDNSKTFINTDFDRPYIVRPGDTLWTIAQRELGNGWRLPEIKDGNGDRFSPAQNEELQPGDTIYLPVIYVEGTGEDLPIYGGLKTPSLSLNADDFYQDNENINFTGNIIDNAQKVNKLDFWLYPKIGTPINLPDITNFTIINGKINFNYSLPDLNPGTYEVKAIAYDTSGKAIGSVSDNFTITPIPNFAPYGLLLPDPVQKAIERSANLKNYNPVALESTQQWVVALKPGENPDTLAESIGAKNLGPAGQLPNAFVWEFPDSLTAKDIAGLISFLVNSNQVEYFYPLVSFRIPIPNDPITLNYAFSNPLFADEWHLNNPNSSGLDANVLPAWSMTLPSDPSQYIRGNGIVIGVVDDGIDATHPDLAGNYRSDLSEDFNSQNFKKETVNNSSDIFRSLMEKLWGWMRWNSPNENMSWEEMWGWMTWNFFQDPVNWEKLWRWMKWNNINDISWQQLWGWMSGNSIDNKSLDWENLWGWMTWNFFKDTLNWQELWGWMKWNSIPETNMDWEKTWGWMKWNWSENPTLSMEELWGWMRWNWSENPSLLMEELWGWMKWNWPASSSLSMEELSGWMQSNYFDPNLNLENLWGWMKWNCISENIINWNELWKWMTWNDTAEKTATNTPYQHGTTVAGVAAAVSNNIGVTGVAPEAELASLRLIAEEVTDWKVAQALTSNWNDIDIYNNSWKANPMFAPPMSLMALYAGSLDGRNDLGSNFVFAGGNDKETGQNVNYNAFANSRHTIAVAAIDENGKQAWYSEPGAPLLISAYSGYKLDNTLALSKNNYVGITTTDLPGETGFSSTEYTDRFGGTSSAAPLVSGVVALMLQANPNLTTRDVQNILIDSAYHNDPSDRGWVKNSAGYWVNYKYGFGAIDATAAVQKALNWTLLPEEVSTTSGLIQVNQNIPDNDNNGITQTVNINNNIKVEWVEVVFDATHPYRGDLEITLTSPDGTESILAEPRQDDQDNYTWVFTSARNWGESSQGEWKLTVKDKRTGEVGTWDDWKLNIFGTAITPTPPSIPSNYYVNPTNGHIYLVSNPGSWTDVQTQAESLGGYLVAINDTNEQNWLVQNFGGLGYIGLTDSELYGATEGNYKWTSGEPVTYTNFQPGEPNNWPTTPVGEDFFQTDTAGKWNDFSLPFWNQNGWTSTGIIEINSANIGLDITQKTVQIKAIDPIAGENGDNGTFRITRSGDISQPLTVNYTISGNATNGSDYNSLPGSITIPVGQSYIDIPINVIEDNEYEKQEQVQLILKSSPNYNINDRSFAATVNIADNDVPTVSITTSDTLATEDGNSAQFVVTRTGNTDDPLTINYAIAGTATNGTDYQNLTGNITIPAGASSATIPINPIFDYQAESNETVTINLTDTAAYNLDTNNSATTTITNSTTNYWYGPFVYVNPANGHLYILTQPDTWLGAQEQAQILGGNLVTINNAAENNWLKNTLPNTPSWIGLNDSPIYGNTEGNFSWVSGEPVTFTDWGPGLPDNILYTPEGEDFTMINFGANRTWNDLPRDSSAIDPSWNKLPGIIEIDPTKITKPIVNLMVTDSEAWESGNAAQIVITRIGDLSQPLTVKYNLAGDAVNNTDYQDLSGSVTIPAGESLITIPIIAKPDELVESNEKLILNLAADSAYTVGNKATGEITIVDENPVNRIYRQVFDRNADAGGLTYWTNRWQSGETLAQVRWAIAHDGAYAETATKINLIYQDLMNRNATAAEISYWQDRLGTDTTLSQVRSLVENPLASAIIPTTTPIYTNPITGNKYFLTTRDTWLGAQEQAQAAGGNLVTINDVAENDWIYNTFRSYGNLWIGITDSPIYDATEGNFKWLSGEPVTYTKWNPTGLNNALVTPEGEDFGELGYGGFGQWNDMHINQLSYMLRQGIVEIPG